MIVPQDIFDPTTPKLVMDMGEFTMTSDLREFDPEKKYDDYELDRESEMFD